ncbi:AMP-binding protein [Clostridium felsineum]|uniref:beta-ketoacyl synthase N-terminal-like domain-containing protein n=1 Tax=Clostridium felsineum TaxID=36839 RepID=UPI00214DBF47|nr:beta-ketoacyl synthase N-terminal-like domain-containing protein [Clostridium felsineum]MCR3757613.1 AMP-binding protein [Clostridium felsineum]
MNESLVSYLYQLRYTKDKGIYFIYGEKDEEYLSYAELYIKAKKMAQYLKKTTYNTMVIQVESSKEFICSIWACLFSNKVVIPLKYSDSTEDFNVINNILDMSENIGVILDSKDKLHNYESKRERIIWTDSLLKYDSDIEFEICEKSNWEDTIMIQFSSGSTGNPKGIITKNKNLISNIESMIKRFNVSGRDKENVKKVLDWIPLTHNLGLIVGHFMTLMRGIDEYVIPTKVFIKNPILLLEKIDEHKISTTHCPNFALDLISKYSLKYNKKNLDLSSLSVVSVGSEYVSAKSCQNFIKCMSRFKMPPTAVQPGYGLTEATVVVSNAIDRIFKARYLNRNKLSIGDKIEEVDEKDIKSVAFVEVGKVMDCCSLKIIDNAGNVLGDNYVGKVLLKGDSIVDGYYLGDEKTKPLEIDDDGWFDTGDLGFVVNGYLTIIGRSKDVIIINGKNLYPLDFESVIINKFTELKRKVVVTGKQALSNGKNEVYAFILVDKIDDKLYKLIDEIQLLINEKFQIKITRIVPVYEFPLTRSGKIQRFKLVELLLNGVYEKNLKELAKYNEIRANSSIKVHNEINEKVDFISNKLLKIVVELLEKDNISIFDNLFDVGFNSVLLIEFMDKINNEFCIEIKVQELINCKSVYDIAKEILKRKENIVFNQEIKDVNFEGQEEDEDDDIAVIGIDLTTADAENSDEFWENMCNGKVSVNNLSGQRIEDSIKALKKIEIEVSEEDFSKGAFMEDIDKFDCRFFKMIPKIAAMIHPQQRIFMQTAWKAFEDAGYTFNDLKGSKTGIFLGHAALPFVNTYYDYSRFILEVDSDSAAMAAPGNLNSMMARRVSQYFGLNGPCVLIDTACSSSLVAIHYACTALRNKECDMALVGSVKIDLFPLKNNKIGIESQDGFTRTFDNKASGTGKGEGSAAVILKPFKQALKDKDNIYAVIKGSAVNNDGNSIGLTVPNMEAQAEVLKTAWKSSKINPEQLSFIEAHGTATKIGDPIEILGITNAAKNYTDKKQFCAITSVKTNIGHLDHAAGIFGFIKAVLAINHGKLPASMNYSVPNENIDFEATPVYVNTKLLDLNKEKDLYCGVSSFGFTGTNCHLVLKGHPNNVGYLKEERCIYKITANNIEALEKIVLKQIEYIRNTNDSLINICYTADVCRNDLKYRCAIIVSSKNELLDKLKYILSYIGKVDCSSKEIYYSNMLKDLEENENENELNVICKKYILGEKVEWRKLFDKLDVNKVHMPGYVFNKKRCWIELS